MSANDVCPNEILAVDDDPASLKLLERILNDAGYRARTTSDGELALRSAKAHPPALILLDIRMPGMDGYQICQRLKADDRTRSIPILFLSALQSEQDKVKAFEAGGVDYINKPFQPTETLARISTHLTLRRAQLELEARNAELNETREKLEERVKERSTRLEQADQRLRQEMDLKLEMLDELRKSELNYRRIIDTANEGVWALGPDFRTVFVNARMAEMLGYQPTEMLGRPLSDFMFDEDAPDHLMKMENHRQGLSEHYERRLRAWDRRTVWTLVSATPVFGSSHNFEGFFGMFTDITARKRAEEEVLTLNRELLLRVKALEEASRELESFSYALSHDMRTPLRAINCFISILLEEYQSRLDETGRNYLQVMRRSTSRMNQLIDRLLEFIRLSRLDMKMEVVDMGALTRDVFASLQSQWPERNIRLSMDELPPAYCDKAMIERTLTHLLANAIKFTASQPEAIIKVSAAAAENQRNVYHVKDNGVGFDARFADKLFSVISRLHSPDEFEGAGVGLAIVRQIVERHGGGVWAEGIENIGATFHFTLPCAEPQ